MNNKIMIEKVNFKNLYLTIFIVLLIILCSGIGIGYPKLYEKETVDWMAQTLGQDISNIFFISPVLVLSAILVAKGSKIAKIIWIGTMLTNIYSYVIYCFAVHFNPLFHVYCVILGLSIYAVIRFFIDHIHTDFKSWYIEKTSTKLIGITLFIIAVIFTLLWLSNSLPAALTNTVPEAITKDALLTNPVHALDFSFYLPLMFFAACKILKKRTEGYLLAPMMLVFAILTNINIINLMFVTMSMESINTTPQIIFFNLLTYAFIGILITFIKNARANI
jgi:hypothetical protein